MTWIENIKDIPSKIVEIVGLILSAFSEVASALEEFYNTLVELKDMILGMVVDPSSGSGLPIYEAIGLVRYLEMIEPKAFPL